MRIWIVFIFTLLLISCEKQESKNTTNNEITSNLPLYLVLLDQQNKSDLFKTNLKIDQKFFGQDDKTIDQAVININIDELKDESVEAKKYMYHLINEQGKWRIHHQKYTFKCKKGHGHVDFSEKACK